MNAKNTTNTKSEEQALLRLFNEALVRLNEVNDHVQDFGAELPQQEAFVDMDDEEQPNGMKICCLMTVLYLLLCVVLLLVSGVAYRIMD